MPSTSRRGTFRTTQQSIFGDTEYLPPYTVTRRGLLRKGLTHAVARFARYTPAWICCRRHLDEDAHYQLVDSVPTCLACVLCRGCPACRDNHLNEATMRLGKWKTMNGRKLYPFEMDSTHLLSAIAKLARDKHHFKGAWDAWLEVLETEAAQRGLG